MISYSFFAQRTRLSHLVPAFCLTVALLLGVTAPAQAKEKQPRTAIVLATFGTTYAQTGDPLERVKAEVAKRHPDIPVFTAYTSEHVAKTLRARGTPAKNLAQTLADMSADGFTHVAVQSLHVIPGKEFDLLSSTAARFVNLPKGMTATSLGQPLIGSHDAAKKLADILAANVPAERTPADAVLFIGHGADADTGSLAYPALQAFVQDKDKNFFVGTIEGPYDVASVTKMLQQKKTKKVWLVPLMTVVGDHARNDIFGDEEDSWKETLRRAGMQTAVVEKGLLALPGTDALWADHLDAALEQLRVYP